MPRPPHRSRLGISALLVLSVLCFSHPAKGVIIELPYVGAPGPFVPDLMSAAMIAKSNWESTFSDPVVLHFAIDAVPLPAGILGYFDVDPVTSSFGYPMVAGALAADATSPADFSAVGSLQPGPALSMITNDTTSAPSLRTHVELPFVYNSELRLTRANQKALGLLPALDGGLGSDGTIVLNSGLMGIMDFDPGDGVPIGFLDMAAILTHEMGHGMGFISGVDHVDYASSDGFTPAPGHPDDLSDDAIFTPLDLYRYSEESVTFPDQPASGAVLDWAAGTSPIFGDNPFFSIDGGATSLALFSTGAYFGDGFQAQHWKDSSYVGPPIGLMDPDIDDGEIGVVTPLDLTALDVVGWTLVPEPSSVVLAAMGLAAAVAVGWRRRRRTVRS